LATRRVPGYEILETLQEQGPAAIYLAREEASGATVVLETVPPSAFSSRGKADRWIIEARNLRKLAHPSLVRVLDTGRSGFIYVAREWLPGLTLGSLLGSDWSFQSAQALAIAAAVAEALAYLHRMKRAHGAVSPATILLGTEGEIRLGGLGGLIAAEPPDPAFVAPEIRAGGPASKPGDLYSLGCVLRALFPQPEADAARPGPIPALIHALTASDPAARPTSTRGVAETLQFLLARELPKPEKPPSEDEVIDLADAVAELGLPLTAYRASEKEPPRAAPRSSEPQRALGLFAMSRLWRRVPDGTSQA
jgi:serine/threonine-protein kinase